MKKTFYTLIISILSSFSIFAQTNCGPLISGLAPSFTAESTQGRVHFPDDYFSKWKIIFSHPADFTPVCTSEILSLSALQDDFKKLNTALIVVSTDGLNSHIEWVKSMESLNYKEQGNIKINFPIVSDVNLEISRKYHILRSDSMNHKDIRSVFFIDPNNNIRAMFYYPSSVGRNMEEIKRTLIALQTQDKYDVLTPANWKPGDDVLIHSPSSIADAEKLKSKKSSDLKEFTWYMWFKKI
jgi:peroxiredoxin (alkyl hydroperoxide reductase subunit C)